MIKRRNIQVCLLCICSFISCFCQNWIVQESTTKKNLNSIFFLNHNEGWCVGYNGTLLMTKDGGETWTKKNLSTGKTLNKIYFYNNDTAWIAGNMRLLLASYDRGVTWQKIAFESASININSIMFVNSKIGWITGNGVLFKTEDGGNTWRQINSDTFHYESEYDSGPYLFYRYNLLSILFTDSLNGFLCSNYHYHYMSERSGGSAIIKTNNAGESWQMINSEPDPDANVMCRVAPNILYSAGYNYHDNGGNSYIYNSLDNGKVWNLIYTKNPDERFNYIKFFDKKTGVLMSHRTFHSTKDGGLTWDEKDFPNYFIMNTGFFLSKDTGWVAGEDGIIMRTNNRDIDIKNKKSTFENTAYSVTSSFKKLHSGYYITLNFHDSIQDLAGISLYTISGICLPLVCSEMKPVNNQIVSIQTESLSKGVYFLRVTNSNFISKTLKITIY